MRYKMQTSFIIIYIIIILSFWIAFIKLLKTTTPKLYTYKNETHDIETWRKRGMELLKDKGQKSRLKYCETAQVVGLLYIFLGWDLIRCK